MSRLMDDIVGHGVEKKITAVNCYMSENGCSEMEALSQLSKRVKVLWKDMNEQMLEPRAASTVIVDRIINLTRVLCIMYVGDDGYTNSTTRLKHFIKNVLVEPIL